MFNDEQISRYMMARTSYLLLWWCLYCTRPTRCIWFYSTSSQNQQYTCKYVVLFEHIILIPQYWLFHHTTDNRWAEKQYIQNNVVIIKIKVLLSPVWMFLVGFWLSCLDLLVLLLFLIILLSHLCDMSLIFTFSLYW